MIINNLKLNIKHTESELIKRACKKANIAVNEVHYFKILKKSLDARNKDEIRYIYTVNISKEAPVAKETISLNTITHRPKYPVAVIGFGPAGMFAALQLVSSGFDVVVIERGEKVEDRQNTVDNFIINKILNEDSNIQFGEGGAGTFSDGKLNTGVKSEYKEYVLNEFVENGAPNEILYLSKPHIGSDYLPMVVKNIREKIEKMGGKILFSTKLIDIHVFQNNVKSIVIEDQQSVSELEVSAVILAIGHSARDTYKVLFSKNIKMESKDLAIGFRIEHKQIEINKAQYGKEYNNILLSAAEYKLTTSSNDRGVFSFCMCPGGVVVAATSLKGRVVTNGMSNHKRGGENSNSAIVTQIRKIDFDNDVLNGMEYIDNLEKKAFEFGGSNYCAPCQLVGDFLSGTLSTSFGKIKPTYPLGTKFSRLDQIFNKDITKSLQEGILNFGRKLKGFDISEAVLTGVETRTSSPVRIIRTDKYNADGLLNLYPAGEIGYAGGIMSAAIDGIKVANAIKNMYIDK